MGLPWLLFGGAVPGGGPPDGTADRAPAAALFLSELMIDPTPTRGWLPAAEYLELYNGGDAAASLAEVGVASGGDAQFLGEGTLGPGEYLIICDADAADRFAPFGAVLGLERFPALSNSGDEVLLLSGNDTIERLTYDTDWYGDGGKGGGGWSLERRSLEATADCRHNWSAAADQRGGTPGGPNSVGDPARPAPVLQRVVAESPEELRLFFDRQLDPDRAADPAAYRLEGGVGTAAALPQAPDFRQVVLLLDAPLVQNNIYTIAVASSLYDCLGTPAAATSRRFGLASPAEAGDLLINEILYRPYSGGRDFIELYNASAKILDLQGLLLINEEKSGGNRIAEVAVPVQLFPGEYIAFSEAPDDILQRYQVERPVALLANPLPALDAERGNLTLRRDGRTLDSLDYRDEWHSPLLEDTRGISLERISPLAPTRQAGNWHSAAAAAGFATPTAPNSQAWTSSTGSDGFFELPRKTFSPDGDGFEDILLINYRADQPGYLLNLRVFDAAGRLVRILAENELLGTQGVLKWDGANDEGQKARLGIYLLWFERFHPDGSVRIEKVACVLAGRL